MNNEFSHMYVAIAVKWVAAFLRTFFAMTLATLAFLVPARLYVWLCTAGMADGGAGFIAIVLWVLMILLVLNSVLIPGRDRGERAARTGGGA